MFGRSSPSRSAAAAPRPAPRPTPTPARPAPAAAPQQSGGMMSGLMGTVATGMAFGAGSEIAHQGVRAMMGGGSGGHGGEAPQQAAPQEAPAQYGAYDAPPQQMAAQP